MKMKMKREMCRWNPPRSHPSLLVENKVGISTIWRFVPNSSWRLTDVDGQESDMLHCTDLRFDRISSSEVFLDTSQASNIAFLLDWAQMSDLDFGLIQQNISIKKASFQYQGCPLSFKSGKLWLNSYIFKIRIPSN